MYTIGGKQLKCMSLRKSSEEMVTLSSLSLLLFEIGFFLCSPGYLGTRSVDQIGLKPSYRRIMEKLGSHTLQLWAWYLVYTKQALSELQR